MINKNDFYFRNLEKQVYEICKDFISSRGISYFHFRRNYKDGSILILTNKGELLSDFFRSSHKEIKYPPPISTHRSLVYFWDEYSTEEFVILTREKHKLYHGITIVNRHKEYYDCVAFAMSASHPSPYSWYLNIFHDLKVFSELFPKIADLLIKKTELERIHLSACRQDANRKFLFLPQKSKRIYITSDFEGYVTTYELLCMRLLCEGKTYKQIGSILSMSPRTVETYLDRLKNRTGLAFHDLLTKSFKILPPNFDCSS